MTSVFRLLGVNPNQKILLRLTKVQDPCLGPKERGLMVARVTGSP